MNGLDTDWAPGQLWKLGPDSDRFPVIIVSVEPSEPDSEGRPQVRLGCLGGCPLRFWYAYGYPRQRSNPKVELWWERLL